jgi:hypothetical protein
MATNVTLEVQPFQGIVGEASEMLYRKLKGTRYICAAEEGSIWPVGRRLFSLTLRSAYR